LSLSGKFKFVVVLSSSPSAAQSVFLPAAIGLFASFPPPVSLFSA
jgi:hypothetical protein